MPHRPLVILTRERADNQAFAAALGAAGFRTLDYPCIETRLLPYDGRTLEAFAAVIFTSRRGVAGMKAAAARLRSAGAVVACVGPSTAAAVRDDLGIEAAIVADPATGESLGRAVADRLDPSRPVLVVRGTRTTGSLQNVLASAGFDVSEIIVYESGGAEVEPLTLGDDEESAVALFASPSAVATFFERNPTLRGRLPCMAIGPTTAAALEGLSRGTVIQADEPTARGVVRALARAGLVPAGAIP